MMDGAGHNAKIGFRLNGDGVAAEPLAGERLSATLRERLEARDVKVGCNAGDCGACTVLLDGEPVCACLTPTHQVKDRAVETLAFLVENDPLCGRLVEAFRAKGAAQCGICTPGMLVSALALLRAVNAPDAAAIEDALGGVLCRCTGYRKIIEAVVEAGKNTRLDVIADGSVGQPIPRLDGDAKLLGHEVFGDDAAPTGTLAVRVLRAPFHHAAFVLGDLDGFAEERGLTAVLAATDVPGLNRFGSIPSFIDQPVFAEGVARFRGEAVAAFVGPSEAIAALDLTEAPVTWTERPVALTVETARDAEAPQLHEGSPGNLMCRGRVASGDVEAGLAAGTTRVSGRFTTSFVEHAYIEPEAGYAVPVAGGVEIHVATQSPGMNLDSLTEILDLPRDKIVIRTTAVGGGFGSKLDLSVQPILALAALKTGQPVRLAYGRVESMQSTTKRHPAEIDLEIAADATGKITGLRFDGAFNTGAYASWGPTVANRVPVHASGPYRVPHYLATTAAIYTNGPPSGAFRGFGVPQSAIAQEVLLDELAAASGQDPLAFRIANALRDGEPTVCGQVFENGVGIAACLEALQPAWAQSLEDARAFNAEAEASGSPLRRGAGLGAGWYGCGNTSMPNPSTIKVGVTPDGCPVLHQGAIDIGQGANTVIPQIFAEALGVSLAEIALVGADTDKTPDAGKTSASRQTFVTGNAARLAGEALRAEILRRSNAMGDGAEITFAENEIRVTAGGEEHVIPTAALEVGADGYVIRVEESYDPPTKALDADGQGEPYAQYGYAAQLAYVEVDTDLGTVRPLKITAAHDVGRAINPQLVEGQVEGGVAQGLGMALMEEFLPGRTENLHDYLIPTIGDVPPIETLIIEVPDAHGPYGAKGLGEHALIPTAPAILNAITRATGAKLRHVPVTPARLRAAILEARA